MFLQHSNLAVTSCERDHRAMRLNSADNGSITGHGATRRIVVCFRHKINSPVRESCNRCLSNPTRSCCTFSNTILSLTGPSVSVFSCVRFIEHAHMCNRGCHPRCESQACFTCIGHTGISKPCPRPNTSESKRSCEFIAISIEHLPDSGPFAESFLPYSFVEHSIHRKHRHWRRSQPNAYFRV